MCAVSIYCNSFIAYIIFRTSLKSSSDLYWNFIYIFNYISWCYNIESVMAPFYFLTGGYKATYISELIFNSHALCQVWRQPVLWPLSGWIQRYMFKICRIKISKWTLCCIFAFLGHITTLCPGMTLNSGLFVKRCIPAGEHGHSSTFLWTEDRRAASQIWLEGQSCGGTSPESAGSKVYTEAWWHLLLREVNCRYTWKIWQVFLLV